jgi:peptidase YpeB-like protein
MRGGVFSLIFTAALLVGGAGRAQEMGGPSLDRILPQIRAHHPGKFYDAEGPWRGPDGQLRYRLKWMTPDGRVVWFDADARTGRVLGPDNAYRGEMREPGRFPGEGDPSYRGEKRWIRGGRPVPRGPRRFR